MRFLVHNLRASRVNLIMNDYAAGLPSPLSFLGLAESIARDLGVAPWTARILPVLHQVVVSEGRTKPEMSAAKSAKSFAPIEMFEDMIGTVDVSIILDLDGVESASAVQSVIERKRIAGGTIANQTVRVDMIGTDGAALGRLSRGYAMISPPEGTHHGQNARVISSGNVTDLQCIADALFPATYEPGSGWFVPVAVGYRLLEDPATAPRRDGTRDPNVPHVFAEPCVGMAELISIRNRRLRDLSENGLADCFWRWSARETYVLGHPAYHPES